MRIAILLICLAGAVSPSLAQVVSPRPVADAEIRDISSMRMRSIELERAKRDSKKVVLPQLSKEQIAKLAEIKDDFEQIQLLQDRIVKIYKTGKRIDFGKISDAAASMSKKATRLDVNLFGAAPGTEPQSEAAKDAKSPGVRQLIIDLDGAIQRFVESPLFADGKIVDLNVSAKSDLDLQTIIRLSHELSVEARKRA